MHKQHGRENDSVEVVDAPQPSEVALREEAMQAFWAEHDIFEQSLTLPGGERPKGDYVFYDGPPFATGLPHYGHILAGTIKDAIPRFWTMNGYRVRRKWGWDCHGLPLENLIEKRLGLSTKRDIEAYGVKNFNEAAREAVLEYADDWQRIIPRMGRFADMEDDYKTMDSSYTESVWWVFSELHKKGLVFEGFKSMHLCPRCGTTLSNFEVNQGYKDIKDIAVTVKLPLLDEAGEPTDTSLLVWTTTPWTLPGNLAAAVHEEHEYTKVKLTEAGVASFVILAKERLAQLEGFQYEVVETMKGSELVGRRYQPPFPWLMEQEFADGRDIAWTIYHADYVELGEEGTGAVHLAPAYGEDDLNLAKEHGVPIVHHVDEAGHFKDFVTDFAGQLVKPKDDADANVSHLAADIEVVKALKERGTLLKKENITHSYPHCWRCDTPLLNYATTSWFVDVPSIREQLVANNQAVNWVPEYVGENRFGKWLEGARDWAVSRQRYWGAPLPIWKNPETGDYKVFGSLAELQACVPASGNTYTVMRHGQSESNVAGIISARKENADGLTQTGREQATAAASTVGGVDLIIHSGYQRTRETAELVAAELGDVEVLEDERLGEMSVGPNHEGGNWDEFNGSFSTWVNRYHERLEGAENRRDVQARMGAVLFELEAKHRGKRILIVSHAGPLFGLESAARGWTPEEAFAYHNQSDTIYFQNAEVRPLAFTPFPHNDGYELDFHRPYIDEIELFEGETKLERVPDVFDCWFESGSMPYGQHHYPFAVDEETFLREHFPAQFIAEAMDQTRGWFYSLIVLGTALFGKSPFENVVVTGLALAEDGKKMSKSLQNYPDPMELVARTGADAMRLYLLTSPIMRGEDLNFSEKEVQELQRKTIGRLHNVLALYELYADGTEARADSTHVLDVWIGARLQELITDATTGYRNYELDKATRPLIDFIDDLSVWYTRRSRDRLKGDDAVERTLALASLRHTLRTLARVMAPAMPFYAEYLWQRVRGEDDTKSVHLAAWPEALPVDESVLGAMARTRDIVTAALEARTKAGLKVRQPIGSVSGPELGEAYATIVLDELNAKAYHPAEAVSIDTELTQELRDEGAVRELVRAIQGMRADLQLVPNDKIVIAASEKGQKVLENEKHQEYVKKITGATKIELKQISEGKEVNTGPYAFIVQIEKV